MTTDETGYAVSEPLAYGEYVIKEAKAPNGYVIDVNQEAVVDITAEKTYDTELSDKRVNATINLVKEDKDTGNRPQGDATLTGAVYGLYAKEDILDPSMDGTVIHKKDSLVGKITTDKNASGTIENLYLGNITGKKSVHLKDMNWMKQNILLLQVIKIKIQLLSQSIRQ